jgi:hypothetical protein
LVGFWAELFPVPLRFTLIKRWESDNKISVARVFDASETAAEPPEGSVVEIEPALVEGASNSRLDCNASRLESAYLGVSMLEMKLNTTTTVDAVGLDPVNVVPYQKTRQLRDRALVLQ